MPLDPDADFLDPKFFKWLLSYDAIDEVSLPSQLFKYFMLITLGAKRCEHNEAAKPVSRVEIAQCHPTAMEQKRLHLPKQCYMEPFKLLT